MKFLQNSLYVYLISIIFMILIIRPNPFMSVVDIIDRRRGQLNVGSSLVGGKRIEAIEPGFILSWGNLHPVT